MRIGLFGGPEHAEITLERNAIHRWGETVSDLLTPSTKVLFPLSVKRRSGGALTALPINYPYAVVKEIYIARCLSQHD